MNHAYTIIKCRNLFNMKLKYFNVVLLSDIYKASYSKDIPTTIINLATTNRISTISGRVSKYTSKIDGFKV